MKNKVVWATFIFVILFTVIFLIMYKNKSIFKKEIIVESTNLNKINMKIASSAFLNNQKIPSQYTCDGVNINPPLSISDVPQNTVSFVLIVDDPDAPGKTWVHWTLWNIDPKLPEISENSIPVGAVEGKTDFGKPGYGGPCPPSGTHRYFFKIYALDSILSLSASSIKQDLEKVIEGHILAKAELVGLYSK